MRKVWHWKFRYRISLTALEVHRISRPLKLTIFWLKTKIIIIETVILMKPSKFNNLLQKIKNALLGWNVVIFFTQFWRHCGFVINVLVLNYFFEKVCWYNEVYLILFQLGFRVSIPVVLWSGGKPVWPISNLKIYVFKKPSSIFNTNFFN